MDVYCRHIINIKLYPFEEGAIKLHIMDLFSSIVQFCINNRKDSEFFIHESNGPDLCRNIDFIVIATEKCADDLNGVVSGLRKSLLETNTSGTIKSYEFKNCTYGKSRDSHK